ncbi:hypothetical protein F0U44_05120 [Nocardioides humilatus]|uniref:Uncharacterized protein n=2 Tax=Nocardioides humilatus TaxID=2607660 RepID=A0A5B1LPS4_9ACTN|nr:hypothetical protein F0U44_05120 [Nocardioides humilatus]
MVALTLVSCSSGTDADPPGQRAAEASPTVLEPLRCDADKVSDHAKDVIEKVGGLHGEGFVVRFAQSTRLGVVALVTGDLTKAGSTLVEQYGVSVVAAWDESVEEIGKGGFRQVDRVVAEHCPS